jgi:cysteinyl-tRNA synthetase
MHTDGACMKVYNTLARKLEEFVPLNDMTINMFVCGQTVYDDAHIGHAKTYIDFDIIARWLRHSGYKVKYIQNITDIDDKIINRAKERGVSAKELSEHYEKRLMADLEAIDVKGGIDMYPRSHDYMDQIKDQIQLLLDKGYAYYLDGDLYYDVDKFADYTKLSGMSLKELNEHRIEPKEGKKNVYDFVLWKASKSGELSWREGANLPAPHERDSPGRGRFRRGAFREVLAAFRGAQHKGRKDEQEPEEFHNDKGAS